MNNPAEFTVETKDAGKAPLKIYAQVKSQRLLQQKGFNAIEKNALSISAGLRTA